MESKIEKISDKKIKINAFNLYIWIRSSIFFAICAGFIIFFIVGGLNLTFENILLLLVFVSGFYLMVFRDWFISYTKNIELEDDYILINKRKFFKKDLDYVSVVVGSVGSAAIIISYRVNLVLKKGFLKISH